jgi:hypothetical protein
MADYDDEKFAENLKESCKSERKKMAAIFEVSKDLLKVRILLSKN